MIIAIDGPAGAGKSTVARHLAEALEWTYLDTGAMYRAVTLTVLERGIDPADGVACAEVARSIELAFDAAGKIQIDGRPGEPRVRGPGVTEAVSIVSAHPAVRAAVVAVQHRLAREVGARGSGLVAEGRDTTTVVFPEADYKFFLIATARERARRRARELHPSDPGDDAIEAVRRELARRDALDSGRATSPLVEARDAIRVETDGLGIAQVVERIRGHLSLPDPGSRADLGSAPGPSPGHRDPPSPSGAEPAP